jgi:hypothetical protein
MLIDEQTNCRDESNWYISINITLQFALYGDPIMPDNLVVLVVMTDFYSGDNSFETWA